MFTKMAFAKPEFPRTDVDAAGDVLLHGVDGVDYDQREDALQVINNWRAAHAYPLNIFQMTLRNRTKQIDSQGIVAQRIKRLSSIEDKLQRLNWLKLSDMQDIAGCRVIVSSVQQVDELVNAYKRKYAGHILDDHDDYIGNPKSDGYRGYHLIYRYHGEVHSEYDDLKVEMQFRSALQHCWATAVETADIFYREGLKAHRGSPAWTRFFALMGAAIANRENTNRVPRTPKVENELINELRQSAGQLDIKRRLTAFGQTLNVIGRQTMRLAGVKYVLLVLEPGAGAEQLRLYGFRASNIDEATKQYETEERFKTAGTDAVLVSVSDAASLQRAYPNYFLDTTLFLQTLDEFIS